MRVKAVLKSIVLTLSGMAVGAVNMRRIMKKRALVKQNSADNRLILLFMMNQWVRIKQEGKILSDYFEKNGCKKIAIYGLGDAGELLLAELKDSNVEVAYGIDRNADEILTDIEILSLEDSLPEVDVIVVTAVTYFDEIQEALSEKTNSKIISLNDILYEI